MNSLLEDLLDTSRIDAGRYTINPQPMDVSQIFEDACSLLTPLATAKAIDMSFHAEPNLKINADPERLFQVLSNLIGNAIKFTPQQGTVGISAMSVGDEIVFSVRDTGEGIAPEQLPHVFERYWTTKEGNPNGTGLGLYISKGLSRPMAVNCTPKASQARAANSALACRKSTEPGTVPNELETEAQWPH